MKPLLETLQAGTDYLARHQVEEARLNMEHLLAHVLECRRLDLYLRFGELLREPDLEKLRALTKQRASGTPLQHLLGTVEFGDLELISDQRALIPRPETEYLCEILMRRFADSPPSRALDMACGSGCIGLSLAHRWPSAEVLLVDLSEEALDLARLNASRLQLHRVPLIRSDLFEKVTGCFDLIVSNLPYIPSAEIPSLSREVRRDPLMALDGGEDGLDVVHRFLQDCPPFLQPEGWISLELGWDQPHLIADKLNTLGWSAIEVLPDLAGVQRFVLARKPSLTE